MEKRLWMICVTHMFIEIFLLVQVALIPVIVQEFELSFVEASLVATVPSLIALLMNIPSGFLADRFNTNHLLFASMLTEGFAAFLISQTSDFWTLVLGASLLKVSSPVYHISGLSRMSTSVRLKRMGRSIGFHNALGNIGSAAGLVSLALLLTTLGWRWTYLLWAFPILAWGLMLLVSPQLKSRNIGVSKTEEKSRFKRLTFVFSASVLVFLVAIGLREVGSTSAYTFMTTYFVNVRGLVESTATLIFGLGPFVGIVGSLCGGYLTEHLGAKKALSVAILGCMASLFLLSSTGQVFLLALLYVAYALLTSLVWSPMNTIVAAVTPESRRGLSYSVYFFAEGLVATVTPTAAAVVIAVSGGVWFIFPFSIAFMALGLAALQFLPSTKQ
ncbi:MAG: MFS transporter [Candidatus Bathyarchaeota archaeon]|jgi:MFS family permease